MAEGQEILQPLDDEDALDALLERPLVLVYKHSPACWQSFRAIGQVRRFALERERLPVFMVDVIRQRPLARRIAERLSVRHESPQVLLVREGTVVWHASHSGVSYDGLHRALEDVETGG